MSVDPELRPLKPAQRLFVHLIVYEGLEKFEAYAVSHKIEITEENKRKLREKSSRLFYFPHINNYYHALMEEIREHEVKKGVWTKEVATEKLVKLIERAEQDIYGDKANGVNPKPLTMGRLNAIVLPVKELNLMNGFNQTNMNVEGCLVQICGEDNLED